MGRVLNWIGGWLEILGAFTESLFEEHKLVRRALVVWAVWEIHLTLDRYRALMLTLDTSTVAGVSTIIGIMATVTAFYIKSRELDK